MRRLIPFAFALAPMLPIGQAVADVYKYVDSSGHVYYTDKPKHSGFQMIIRTPPEMVRASRRLAPQPSFGGFERPERAMYSDKRNRFSPIIEATANKYSLDPSLLHAVIQTESAYNPGAVSNKGAAGLMQLMPGTASRYGVRDRFDPEENIEGGARYLSDLLDLFQSNVKLAVAAYNSGENNVIKYGYQIPPFPETQGYVVKVMQNYRRHSGDSARM